MVRTLGLLTPRGRALLACCVAALACAGAGPGQQPRVDTNLVADQDNGTFARQRDAMVVSQIEARGITNPAVLAAMRKVPRHRFVPLNAVDDAYVDGPLPIGHQQTISQP